MKSVYEEYFYIGENEKIREKVVNARLIKTVVIVVCCLLVMSFSAYAYFTCNISSDYNKIQAAKFDAQVTINDEVAIPVATQDFLKTYRFEETGEYTIKLSLGESTAETGFCVIYIGDAQYYTQQIGTDINAENGIRESVSFVLDVKSASETQPVEIMVESHWGTSANYYNVDAENEEFIIKEPNKVITVGTVVIEENGEEEQQTDESDKPIGENDDEDLEAIEPDVVEDIDVNEPQDENSDEADPEAE